MLCLVLNCIYLFYTLTLLLNHVMCQSSGCFYLWVICRFELLDFLLMFLTKVSFQLGNLLCQLFPPFLVIFWNCIFHALDFGWKWSTSTENILRYNNHTQNITSLDDDGILFGTRCTTWTRSQLILVHLKLSLREIKIRPVYFGKLLLNLLPWNKVIYKMV